MCTCVQNTVSQSNHYLFSFHCNCVRLAIFVIKMQLSIEVYPCTYKYLVFSLKTLCVFMSVYMCTDIEVFVRVIPKENEVVVTSVQLPLLCMLVSCVEMGLMI